MNVATVHHGYIDEAIKKIKELSFLTMDRHYKVGPEELSRKWTISLQMAKDMLEVTMQHGVWMVVHPMSRRLRVDHLHLHRPRLQGMWFLDTLIAKVKLLLGNKCTNVFTNGKFTKVVLIASRADAGHHRGNLWNLNDPVLNQNDCESKRLFFNIGSKIHNNIVICFKFMNHKQIKEDQIKHEICVCIY
jgi:hypothetical protein